MEGKNDLSYSEKDKNIMIALLFFKTKRSENTRNAATAFSKAVAAFLPNYFRVCLSDAE
jgi:hypothetical protein